MGGKNAGAQTFPAKLWCHGEFRLFEKQMVLPYLKFLSFHFFLAYTVPPFSF